MKVIYETALLVSKLKRLVETIKQPKLNNQYKFEINQLKISIYHEFDEKQYLMNAHQFRLQKIHCKKYFMNS